MFPSIFTGRTRFITEAEKKITQRLSRADESKEGRKDFFHYVRDIGQASLFSSRC